MSSRTSCPSERAVCVGPRKIRWVCNWSYRHDHDESHCCRRKLQAEGLGLVDRLEQTQEPMIVTNRGRGVVEVIPVRDLAPRPLRRSDTVLADVVAPIVYSWNIER